MQGPNLQWSPICVKWISNWNSKHFLSSLSSPFTVMSPESLDFRTVCPRSLGYWTVGVRITVKWCVKWANGWDKMLKKEHHRKLWMYLVIHWKSPMQTQLKVSALYATYRLFSHIHYHSDTQTSILKRCSTRCLHKSELIGVLFAKIGCCTDTAVFTTKNNGKCGSCSQVDCRLYSNNKILTK